jgi:hypothetical protein
MKNSMLLIALTSLMACAPVISTVSISSLPDDAAACTVATLHSLRYDVLDDSPDGIKAERDKHVRNPISGAGDMDRITAVVASGALRVVGETVRIGDFPLQQRHGLRRLSETQTFRTAPSRQLRADVATIVAACGVEGENR